MNVPSMKYPKDVFVAQTNTKTFSISAFFEKRKPEDDSPMKVFDDNFTRFVFTGIEKENNSKKVVYFNLKPDDVAGIDKLTNACVNLYVEQQTRSTIAAQTTGGIDTSGPAFQKKFFSGNLKGKSPAEILIEKGWDEGGKLLKEQYIWLKNNLEKFPKNKELMDAITLASKIDPNELAKLNGAEASGQAGSRKPIKVLDIGMRPLQRKKREDGKCLVYEGSVTWDFSKDKYPVSVNIKNYWAPVNVNANGTLNVIAGQKADEKTFNFSLTLSQWTDAVSIMTSDIDIFRRMYMPEMMKLAQEAYMKSINDAKDAANTPNAQ